MRSFWWYWRLCRDRSVRPDVAVSDVVAHSMAYGGQGFLLLWGLRPVFGVVRGAALATAGATVFGLLTEVVQSVLPYRDFSLADLGADAVGAVVGVGIAVAFGFGRRSRVRSQ